MDLTLTFAIFSLCFSVMAIGLLISGKTLKKKCGDTPEDCSCLKEGKDPEKCSSS
jgi:hypothetical protein